MSVVLFIVATYAFYILFIMFNSLVTDDDGMRACVVVFAPNIYPKANQEKENEKKRRREKKSKNATQAQPHDWMRSVCVRRSCDHTAEIVDVCAFGSSRQIHTIPTT